jgi:radical SAM protein (TIGR01212 family)
VDIVVELGLQTVNYHALDTLNRNHGLAEFIDAVLRIKSYGLETCVHYIVDLPMDDMRDTIEGAKILSALGVEQVKCHSLFILKDTPLGDMYLRGEISPISKDEYIERLITFLEYLNPGMVVQRLVGRAPADRTLFCNWDTSWWKLQEMAEKKMMEENRFQGKLYGYLNGEQRLKNLF